MPVVNPKHYLAASDDLGSNGIFIFDYKHENHTRSIYIAAENREAALEEMRSIRSAVILGKLTSKISWKAKKRAVWLEKIIKFFTKNP